MKKHNTFRLAPPGVNLNHERTIFGLGGLAAILYAAAVWFGHYGDARDELYQQLGRQKILIPGAQIAPFRDLLGTALAGFAVAVIMMLGMVVWNYQSYRQGSMSIYLMRRLPDKNLIHRQCWTYPVLGMALYVLTALVLLGIFYLVYRFATPAECLP